MSADNIVNDGETVAYRVRIRFPAGDGWARWHRAAAAPTDYTDQETAEAEALKCWRHRDGDTADWREPDVEVTEVVTTVRPVARITPASVSRIGGE